jgi:hypothetical protein
LPRLLSYLLGISPGLEFACMGEAGFEPAKDDATAFTAPPG